MPMGSSRQGGLLLRRAPLRVEDPRGLQRKHSLRDFHNKGQCDERLAQAVWARVIASGGLCERSAQKKRRRRDSASSQH